MPVPKTSQENAMPSQQVAVTILAHGVLSPLEILNALSLYCNLEYINASFKNKIHHFDCFLCVTN